MTDNKIPVLTEVYQPKNDAKQARKADPTQGITPELISRVAAHVKPRLEAEITQSVMESLSAYMREEIMKDFAGGVKQAQEDVVSNTKDFVDKIKADLKTDLPKMYQESVELAQLNLNEKFGQLQSDAATSIESKLTEALSRFDVMLSDVVQTASQAANTEIANQAEQVRSEAGENLLAYVNQEVNQLQQKMLADNQSVLDAHLAQTTQSAQQLLEQALQAFQEQMLIQHQAQLNEALSSLKQQLVNDAEVKLGDALQLMQEKMETQHQTTLNASLDAWAGEKVSSVQSSLNESMHAFQDGLRAMHEQQLQEAMNEIVQNIHLRVEESTQEQIGLMDSRLGTIQQETLANVRETFNQQKQEILQAAAREIETAFAEQMTARSTEIREQFLKQVKGDLPEVQKVLKDNIMQILSNTIPEMEERLRTQLAEEIRQLLLKVKFVLPE